MSAIASTAPSSGRSRRGFHYHAVHAECPFKFALRERLHLEPARVSPALALGILAHIYLMWRYLGRAAEQGVDLKGLELRDPFEAMRQAPARVAYRFSDALELCAAYERGVSHDLAWRILDVEREFEVHVRGEVYTQRVDLVVATEPPRWWGAKRNTEAVYFIDHKTTSGRVSEDAPEWRSLDGQNLGYAILGKLLSEDIYGLPFGSVKLNLLGTQTPHEFAAADVRLPALGREFVESIAATRAAILADAEKDPWACERRGLVSGACEGRYGACDYAPICLAAGGGKEVARMQYAMAIDEATELREGSGA